MSDHELAVNHIDQLEKRLASLHDLGVDTAGLRSQLAFARTQVHEGRVGEALGICEEVADTARRLADGSAPPPERPRTGRFTRDQLAEAVKDLLSQGLLAKLMAEQRSGPDVRLETRLSALDEHLRTYIGHEADALRAEQQLLRDELEKMRRSLDAVGTLSRSQEPAPAIPTAIEPVWAQTLGTTLQAVAERLVNQPSAPAPRADEPAWAQSLGTALQTVAERLQHAPAVAESGAPAWAQGLRDALDAVATRLSAQSPTPIAEPSAPPEPAWSQALREALAGAEARHQDLLATVAARAPQEVNDGRLGDQLAGAFERGLHDLGAMLAQHHADMGPQPMDESRGALSPVTVPEQKTTSVIANTTTRSDRSAVAETISPELLKKLVKREVESHLGGRSTAAITNRDAGIDDVRALIAAELDVRQGGGLERTGRADLADLRSGVLRLLPELLNDEAVRHSLFAVLALEAVSKPGALGELTGLRAFLRRELSRAADELATKLQPL